VTQPTTYRCNTCGFTCPWDKQVTHDCYWVLRERGELARVREMEKAGAAAGEAVARLIGPWIW